MRGKTPAPETFIFMCALLDKVIQNHYCIKQIIQ